MQTLVEKLGMLGSHTADPEQMVPRGVCPLRPAVFLRVCHLIPV